LEEALLQHLEKFLLELGGAFTFVGRQRRLRVRDEWYRVDLLFFHRHLRSLVVIDLKVGRFTLADAGQMHLHLNHAREHWMQAGANPPVGSILCSNPNDALAKYALRGLPNQVPTREYSWCGRPRSALPTRSRKSVGGWRRGADPPEPQLRCARPFPALTDWAPGPTSSPSDTFTA
jgi:hypothetical protein